jgi:hypothetical protein
VSGASDLSAQPIGRRAAAGSFQKNKRGILEADYSDISDGKFPEWFVRGGKGEPVTIKIKLEPRSRLKLAPTSSENKD